ncbi:MAG: LysM peptidoglycan-binding domain-containing protein [Rhodocyclaceae bacterium]|nr:LysM peptidoglycan-binding domain-containing protein [Rhodocyclaceae bacterium]MDZ4214285.1 LysM peptidoglycan-binding domain-containing protein [Rhodocyclaceae bacterium]
MSLSTASFAQHAATPPLEIAADAPERHIVVPGDTLWGIAAKFLKDPFRWPELWKMNAEQVKNPHRIYPGQVVILDMSGDQPQLKLGIVKLGPQVHSQPISKEIPAISPQAIEPFLSQPLVIDAAGFDQAPRIVAPQENRVYTGSGDQIYVSGADPQVKSWQIFRPGKPFVDPDSKEVLGLEAIFLGNARALSESAEGITTMEITSVKQEIGRGDRLVPAGRPEIASYMPRLPTQDIQGRILTLYGGVGEGGRHSIVSLSRGKLDGLEMGHVLAIYRAGAAVTNRFEDGKPQTHQLPDERYGLVFIFRVFDRVSYALVMDAARSVVPGDKVRKP